MRGQFEIQFGMRLASRVELRLARRAGGDPQVFSGGQLVAAHPAQHRRFGTARRRPRPGRVVGELFMAQVARVPELAAPVAQRDHVEDLVIVRAAGLGIHAHPVHRALPRNRHRLLIHAA